MFRPRCILPLTLALAWAPASHAFPPCPSSPLELIPIDDAGGTVANPASTVWAVGYYSVLGKPEAFAPLPEMESTTAPISKCRDRIQVALDHVSNGVIGMQPKYAPEAGYGLIALPELRYTAQPLNLHYTFSASIDGRSLPQSGSWVDSLQLSFFWSSASSPATSAVYRLRKSQGTDQAPMISIVESRPAHPDRIVATLRPSGGNLSVPLQLRWEARTVSPGSSTSGAGSASVAAASGTDDEQAVVTWNVDSALEVRDGQNTLLYRIELPGQAPYELQMGLLDYNAIDVGLYRDPLLLDMNATGLSVGPLSQGIEGVSTGIERR
jgi:hypothetical protein